MSEMSESNEKPKIAIGIDLGTTNSCVGIWRNGKVEIIANDQGNRTTPSYVSFNNGECLVGEAAKYQAAMNPDNTIFDAKRLIGRAFLDDNVQADMKFWPFTVVPVEDKPYIETHNPEKLYSPEQISSMILVKMRQFASAYLGEDVTNAVITVPAYFNDAQRQATKDAGRIAGLNVLRIINEPTAASLAYGLEKYSTKETTILIFDCGGGTHDVTLLTVDDGLFQVKATAGNTHLGGEDMDNRIVAWCVEDFKRKHNLDISGSSRALRRLRNACERSKHILSTASQTTIEVDSLFEGIDYQMSITRARFEQLCHDIFMKTMEPVVQVLHDSKTPKSKIDEVVLVGGSTRIPKIRQLLMEYFDGKRLNESVNPDEAVAYGAAVQAAILTNPNQKVINSIVMVDVTPLSLGIETVGGLMAAIINRNDTIPCKKSKLFSTYADNQTTVNIEIFEGERKFTRDNNRLGIFSLEGIVPAPRGTPHIEVTFDMDANGILNVTAHEKTGNKVKNITITNNRKRFTDEQIDDMIKEARRFEDKDNQRKKTVESRNELENYIINVRQTVTNPKYENRISASERQKLEVTLLAGTQILDEKSDLDAGSYDLKRKGIEDVWNPLAVRIYSEISKEKAAEKPVEKSVEESS